MVTADAILTNTTIYAAEVVRPHLGDYEVAHVIGYQNSVDNISGGPNAMILPIPAAREERLGPDNIIDTRSFSYIVTSYGKAVDRLDPHKPRRLSKSLSFGEEPDTRSIQVFDSGNYTVALVDNPGFLKEALTRLPENKRPQVQDSFLKGLEKLYPDWPIAVCCFDGQTVTNPEPLLWWFRPRFPHALFAPALDAHDGNAPSIEHQVRRDHNIAFSSYRMKGLTGDPDRMLMSDINRVPGDKRWLFGRHFKGRTIKGMTGNGDFTVPISVLTDDNIPTWLPQLDVTPPLVEPRTSWERLV